MRCKVCSRRSKRWSKASAIDNTSDEKVAAWIDTLKQIRPYKVMIYTIDRETPVRTLEKIPKVELDAIADRIHKETGIEVSVSY